MTFREDLRLQLGRHVCAIIRGWPQHEAAVLVRLNQSDISRLRAGAACRFTADRLLLAIAKSGHHVTISIHAMQKRLKETPTITVLRYDRYGRLLVAVIMLAATSCGLPRDADGTLDRVTGGVMRVGMVVDTPWVTDSAGGAGGVEGSLAYVIADELEARIEWHHGGESRLLERLHRRELDLVIAGLTTDSPWARKVALTQPYLRDSHGREHVVAVAPGENAFLVRVERILREQRP